MAEMVKMMVKTQEAMMVVRQKGKDDGDEMDWGM